jgi:hypothetical protein
MSGPAIGIRTLGFQGLQVVREDVLANPLSLLAASLLVEAEVNPAVDPGIVDVVGDLLQAG